MPKPSVFFNQAAIRAAVLGSATQTGALVLLGMRSSTSNQNRLKDACTRYGISPAGREPALPVPRTVGRFADESAVREAVADATSYRSACLDLGVSASGKTYAMLDEACQRLGISPPPLGRNRGTTPEERLARTERKALVSFATLPEVQAAFAGAETRRDVLLGLNLRTDAVHYKWLSRFAQVHGLSLPLYRPRGRQREPLESLLVRDRLIGSSSLRRRLIAERVLPEECSECGIGPAWRNRRLVLQLDHANGDKYDNRRGNLRLLCPNCHSQTETFGRGMTAVQKPALAS